MNVTIFTKLKTMGLNLLLFAIVLIVMFFIIVMRDSYDLNSVFIIMDLAILALSPFIFLFSFGKARRAKRRIEKETIVNKIDLDYYRDIISGYSPALISVIYDGQIDFKKDLVASLLYLQTKGYITIEKNSVISTGKNYSDLPDILQFVLDNVTDISKFNLSPTLKSISSFAKELTSADKARDAARMDTFYPLQSTWIKLIENKMISDGLGKPLAHRLSLITVLLIILLIGQFIYGLSTPGSHYQALCAFVMLLFVLVLSAKAQSYSNYALTQKGYEIYKKICGLKRFITDFTRLPESQIDAVTVWDDYVVYSIILNSRGHLNEEARDLYERLITKPILD